MKCNTQGKAKPIISLNKLSSTQKTTKSPHRLENCLSTSNFISEEEFDDGSALINQSMRQPPKNIATKAPTKLPSRNQKSIIHNTYTERTKDKKNEFSNTLRSPKTNSGKKAKPSSPGFEIEIAEKRVRFLSNEHLNDIPNPFTGMKKKCMEPNFTDKVHVCLRMRPMLEQVFYFYYGDRRKRT